jgi:hypothetical protein
MSADTKQTLRDRRNMQRAARRLAKKLKQSPQLGSRYTHPTR